MNLRANLGLGEIKIEYILKNEGTMDVSIPCPSPHTMQYNPEELANLVQPKHFAQVAAQPCLTQNTLMDVRRLQQCPRKRFTGITMIEYYRWL